MRTYLLKRLLLVPLTLFGITLLTFGVMKLAPGDPAKMLRQQAGGGSAQAAQANLEVIEEWKRERGLDKPWYVQYGKWAWDMVRFDLGTSFTPPRARVTDRIWDGLKITLVLNLVAFILIYLIALPIGIICAAKQFTLTDRILTVAVFLLYSLPAFWVGTMMVAFLTSKEGFQTRGFYGEGFSQGVGHWMVESFRHSALPIICLTYTGFAFLSRQMRSSLLEQIRQDYVRTARAKGLHERVVLLRHAVRNALIPIITLFGTLLPSMIGGSIIIEQIFSIPGMGTLFFTAINERDYPTIMGIETITALLTMLGILISDFLYVAVNPTISYE